MSIFSTDKNPPTDRFICRLRCTRWSICHGELTHWHSLLPLSSEMNSSGTMIDLSLAAKLPKGSWSHVVHDYVVGCAFGTSRLALMVVQTLYLWTVRPFFDGRKSKWTPSMIKTFHEDDNSRDSNDNRIKVDNSQDSNDNLIKVGAVGFGRTGTYSIYLALNELGYNTFHTMHLPEQIDVLQMLHETIFKPSIHSKKVMMGEPDLQFLANRGFNATADLPMALYYEQILRDFPDCKFILSTRDNSELWVRSFQVLMTSISNRMIMAGWAMPTLRKCAHYLRWLHVLITDDPVYFTTTFLRKMDDAKAIQAYEEHNQNVRKTIPSNQLLEFNVREGWEPLCEFLSVENCPKTPFPRSNSARFMRTQADAAFYSGILVIVGIVAFVTRRILQRT